MNRRDHMRARLTRLRRGSALELSTPPRIRAGAGPGWQRRASSTEVDPQETGSGAAPGRFLLREFLGPSYETKSGRWPLGVWDLARAYSASWRRAAGTHVP